MYHYKPMVFLLVSLLCGIASFANAQVQIKTNGVFAHEGEIKTVEIEVMNELPINGLEFYIQLPNCMDFVKNEDAISYKRYKVYIARKEQETFSDNSDFQLISSLQDDSCIKVLTFSPTAKQLKENEKTNIKFDIYIDDTFSKDETITISRMKIPALVNDSTLAVFGFDEIDIAVKKVPSTRISKVDSDENNSYYTIDGKLVNEVQRKDIYISNGKKYLIKD